MSLGLISLITAGVSLASLGYKIYKDVKDSKTKDAKINIILENVPEAAKRVEETLNAAKSIKK